MCLCSFWNWPNHSKKGISSTSEIVLTFRFPIMPLIPSIFWWPKDQCVWFIFAGHMGSFWWVLLPCSDHRVCVRFNLHKARIDWKKIPFSMLQSAVEAYVYRGESEVLALRRESTRFNCYIIWFFMYCYPKDLTVCFQLNRNGIFVEAYFLRYVV